MYSLPAPLKGILVDTSDTNTPTCRQTGKPAAGAAHSQRVKGICEPCLAWRSGETWAAEMGQVEPHVRYPASPGIANIRPLPPQKARPPCQMTG
jgi:hypothetical protein